MKKQGGISALAGWYHPYQRILQRDLAYCSVYYGMNCLTNYYASSLLGKMITQYDVILPNIFKNSTMLAIYPSIIRDSINYSSDPKLQTVFIHHPYPHSPYVYDLEKQILTPMNSAPRNYFGNLALADKTLGEVRKGMEKAGVWDKTMVIVTSDHWWRSSKGFDGKEDHRVPFMVKLPGQKSGYVYQKKFNTVIMKDMILALFRKEFTDASELAGWLDKNGKQIDPVIAGSE